MPVRNDAVEGVDYIITEHPDHPSLQCKAWLNEDGSIRDYRSLGNDGRSPGHLIKAPQVLLDNRRQPGDSSLVEIRWRKNEEAINEAVNEWAADLLKRNYFKQDIIDEAEEMVDDILAGRRNFNLSHGKLKSLSEEDSTKLLVRLMLERMSDRDDKPPLRDMVQTVKEVLKLTKRTPDTDNRKPVVAVQVNITEGLFSKGFGHE